MSHPYTPDTATTTALSPAAVNKYRELIARDEYEISELLPVAAGLRNDLHSCEELIAELRKSVERYRHKLGEDTISRLGRDPEPTPQRPMANTALGQELTQPMSCAACGFMLAIRSDQGIWTHAGRELLGEGYLCWPSRPDSTVATPPLTVSEVRDQMVAPLPTGVSPIGELDEQSTKAMNGFLDEHTAIGQDGTR